MTVVWLLLFDRAVPPLLERAERRHYEGAAAFRFENSDLFGLGPFVQYLREHPRHERRRVLFFGNSMVFGYFLTPAQTLPAQFEKLQPGARVYNAAVNGQELGTSYLIAKAIVDSVDVMVVQVVGNNANPMLPSLIPVDDADLLRFDLGAPDRVEQRLQAWLGRVWALYRVNGRMQAALFGTSARNYLYSHKSAALWWREQPNLDEVDVAPIRPSASHLVVNYSVAETMPGEARQHELAAQEPWLWEYATFLRAHGKRAIFFTTPLPDAAGTDPLWADLNRVFRHSVLFVKAGVPPDMKIDNWHLSASGARAIAEMLDTLTSAELEPTSAVH